MIERGTQDASLIAVEPDSEACAFADSVLGASSDWQSTLVAYRLASKFQERWKAEVGRAPFLRLLCGLAALAFSGCVVAFVLGRWRRALIASGLAVAALAVSPVEVSIANRPGPPRIVPVIAGLPELADHERARRGEVILIGCMATGYEPRWVVIW